MDSFDGLGLIFSLATLTGELPAFLSFFLDIPKWERKKGFFGLELERVKTEVEKTVEEYIDFVYLFLFLEKGAHLFSGCP